VAMLCQRQQFHLWCIGVSGWTSTLYDVLVGGTDFEDTSLTVRVMQNLLCRWLERTWISAFQLHGRTG